MYGRPPKSEAGVVRLATSSGDGETGTQSESIPTAASTRGSAWASQSAAWAPYECPVSPIRLRSSSPHKGL
jgi:hypothetical protein